MSQFPHISAGDPLPRRADLLNAQVRAAADLANRPAGQAGRSFATGNPAVIRIKNNSGSNVAKYGVLGLGDVQVDHATNADAFLQRVYMDGDEPTTGTHEGRFAIAMGAIRDGEIGYAAVSGLVQCQVNVRNEFHDRADIKDTDLTQLDSGPVGAAKILWVAGTSGTQWAIVDLNHAQPTTCFWAKITGNAADGTNKWKYAWTEQERTSAGWQDLTGGRSGTTSTDFALNSLEASNSGSGVQGNSIDIDGAVFTDNSDLEIQPVQGDPVVRMYVEPEVTAGALAYSFEYVNAVDGECA